MGFQRISVLFLMLISQPVAAQDNDGFGSLIADLETMRIRNDVPAVGIAIVEKDSEWSTALGVMDVATGETADADTVFRIGSITKVFTSAAVLIAAEQGHLDLDDPIRRIAPDAPFENPWASTRPVTFEQLLEHTAGLYDIRLREFMVSDPTPMTLEQSLAFDQRSRVLQWPPGMHSSYSNAGAGLAAYALEHATGMKYEDFVRERIFEPLDMRHAGFFVDDYTRENLATGYQGDGQTVIPYWHVIFRPFGGINASPKDMASFVRMLVNRGQYSDRRVLSTASISRMEQPRTTLAARSGLSYGYGLGSYAYMIRGIRFQGHGGDGDGFLSRFGYISDAGVGYFLVINSANGGALNRMKRRIERYLSRGLDVPESIKAKKISPELLQSYAGIYKPQTVRFRLSHHMVNLRSSLRIAIDGDALLAIDGRGENDRLIPVSDQHFRRDFEPLATTAFIEDAGVVYLQGPMGNFVRVPEWQYWLQRGVFWLVLLVMFSSTLFGVVWVSRSLLGHIDQSVELRSRLVPLLAVLSIWAAYGLLRYHSDDIFISFGQPSLWSVGFFFLTLIFAALSIFGVWICFLSKQTVAKNITIWHSRLVSTANVVAAIYLSYWGVIGLRTWV